MATGGQAKTAVQIPHTHRCLVFMLPRFLLSRLNALQYKQHEHPHYASSGSSVLPLGRKIAIIVREIFISSLDDDLTVGERWERSVEGPMFIASLLFLALYVLSACVNPGSTESIVAETGMWILWATFLADYLARLTLAENRWK